ncbi:sulfite exporter TauE/SafE family protein [Cellulomonas aerilata]|uniref:Probable membrane transporter protein n=1 Tax=Cellulomonas aerilata TaxID=515326 RepID=A0A512DCN2_9CELL|nr:sulfite exporter TauE/SafE family protein [Cellulomonas aerilata]GEO34242.1 UPF0721 transmembrane protein [Cellulomonas aerilata]
MPALSALALSPLDVVLLAVAACLVGLSKTALPGAGTLAVAVFAAVLPARESTGTLLVLLIVGDLFAVRMYHAHADFPTLRRMVPTVLVGVGVGAVFLALAGDTTVRRVIAVILLALVGVTLARRRAAARRSAPPAAPGGVPAPAPAEGSRRLGTGVYGTLAGFTTMVANAGGPVMSLYLLAARFPVQQFLGTAAWFFLAVNLAKTPFSVALGLISLASLTLDLMLAPAVVVGALVGRRVARRIDQAVFERLVLTLTVVSAGYLLVQ